MKLHPEYNDMIMPFYAKMYDKYPYNEDDPFNFEDNHLFFGRDEQITELASRLRKNRFVAVVGTS